MDINHTIPDVMGKDIINKTSCQNDDKEWEPYYYLLVSLSPMLVIFIGTIGNTTTFIVLNHKLHKGNAMISTLRYITILDTVILWTAVLNIFAKGTFQYDLDGASHESCIIWTFSGVTMTSLESWSRVAITGARFLQMVSPRKLEQICSQLDFWNFLALLHAGVVAIHGTVYIVVYTRLPNGTFTRPCYFLISEVEGDSWLLLIITVTVNFVFPCVLLVVFTTKIFVALRGTHQHTDTQTLHDTEQHEHAPHPTSKPTSFVSTDVDGVSNKSQNAILSKTTESSGEMTRSRAITDYVYPECYSYNPYSENIVYKRFYIPFNGRHRPKNPSSHVLSGGIEVEHQLKLKEKSTGLTDSVLVCNKMYNGVSSRLYGYPNQNQIRDIGSNKGNLPRRADMVVLNNRSHNANITPYRSDQEVRGATGFAGARSTFSTDVSVLTTDPLETRWRYSQLGVDLEPDITCTVFDLKLEDKEPKELVSSDISFERNEHSISLTRLLVGTNFLFICLNLPFWVFRLFFSKPLDSEENDCYVQNIIIQGMHLLKYSNHSLNLFLYCAAASRFQHDLQT